MYTYICMKLNQCNVSGNGKEGFDRLNVGMGRVEGKDDAEVSILEDWVNVNVITKKYNTEKESGGEIIQFWKCRILEQGQHPGRDSQ